MNICVKSLQSMPLTGNPCPEKLGLMKAVVLYDSYKEITRTVSSSGVVSEIDWLTVIKADLNNGTARLLTGMRGRAAANTAAVTGTLEDYNEQLAPVAIADTFQFIQSVCGQEILKSLVGFNGFAFVICQAPSGKLQIAYQQIQNSLNIAPIPLSITAMDTTGMFADAANIQTITLTFNWGYVTDFVLGADYFNGSLNQLPNPVEVMLLPNGTANEYAVVNKCSKVPYDLTGLTVVLSNVLVNGATPGTPPTVTVSADNLFSVSGLTTSAGDQVSFTATVTSGTGASLMTVAQGTINYVA